MKRSLISVALIASLIPGFAAAYTITTPFSSFEVLDETAFLARYSSLELVTSLSDSGSGLHPHVWVVRGYWSGEGSFWEDVSFGYERGIPSPYPIIRTGGTPITPRPMLSILAPDSLISAVALAVYTDQGFFGIVPSGPDDKFYTLPPPPGSGAEVTTIFSISTASPIPEPPVGLLLSAGLCGAFGVRRLATTRAALHA